MGSVAFAVTAVLSAPTAKSPSFGLDKVIEIYVSGASSMYRGYKPVELPTDWCESGKAGIQQLLYLQTIKVATSS